MKRKLSLNKEVLISLQEKQMKSLVGAEMLISEGETSNATCAPHGGECNPTVPSSVISCDSCYTCPTGVAMAASCCEKTCND